MNFKSLIIKATFSVLLVLLFSFMSEKSDLFEVGGRTGELVLKDWNMGLAAPLSSTLQECLQEQSWEMAPGRIWCFCSLRARMRIWMTPGRDLKLFYLHMQLAGRPLGSTVRTWQSLEMGWGCECSPQSSWGRSSGPGRESTANRIVIQKEKGAGLSQ